VVSFTSANVAVCTVSGTTVTLVAAAVCNLEASQAGNANYNAALDVTRSFTITSSGKTSQTITFAALSDRLFGVAPFSVSASASSGLPVDFSSLTATVCTISGATVTILAVGTCSVRAAQSGNVTYAAAPTVDQSFAVSQGAQSISFGAIGDKPLAASPITVNATASSGLAVSFASLSASICTVSNNLVTLVTAGTCTIRASQAGNASF